MAILQKIMRNYYRDSVLLMQLSSRLVDLPRVVQASAVMATGSNVALLIEAGLLEGQNDAGPNDLLILIQGDDVAFLEEPGEENKTGEKRFTVGTAYTRDMAPEEFGTLAHVQAAAQGVKEAIRDAGIEDPADIHFVQIKTGALTTERIKAAYSSGKSVVTTDTYKSMSYARSVAALGIGIATGEIEERKVTEDVIGQEFSLYSNVASTSSGIELMNCEIIVMGNSSRSTSELIIDHAVMKDPIDAGAVRQALGKVGFEVQGELAEKDRQRLVNVFVKCEPDPSGATRGRRHVMFEDSDINYTRHIRAVVNAVVASVTGDTMCYISAGAEHQGPPGGGVIAVLTRNT